MSFLRAFRKEGFPPRPGSLKVGTFDLLFGKGPDSLLARLYYPTPAETAEAKAAAWLPDRRYAAGYANFMKMNQAIFGRLFWFIGGSEEAMCLWETPLLPNGTETDVGSPDDKLPVIIFSHGLAGMRTSYSALCCTLASEGFLVAAIEHRDMTACATFFKTECGEFQWLEYQHLKPGEKEWPLRNRQLRQRAAETSRLLDLLEKINAGEAIQNELNCSFDLKQLKNRLDLNKVAMAGHSFGGTTSIRSLLNERFKCAVVYDAWMFPFDRDDPMEMKQPILFLNAENFHWPENIRKIKSVIEKDPARRKMFTIRGTGHQFCTDFGFVFRTFLARRLKFVGELSHAKALELNHCFTSAFLQTYLECKPDAFDSLLEGEVGKDKNVMIGSPVKETD